MSERAFAQYENKRLGEREVAGSLNDGERLRFPFRANDMIGWQRADEPIEDHIEEAKILTSRVEPELEEPCSLQWQVPDGDFKGLIPAWQRRQLIHTHLP